MVSSAAEPPLKRGCGLNLLLCFVAESAAVASCYAGQLLYYQCLRDAWNLTLEIFAEVISR